MTMFGLIFSQINQIYLATGKTDLHKVINGLVTNHRSIFDLNPYQGSLFLFYNSHKNRFKEFLWQKEELLSLVFIQSFEDSHLHGR